ncbi:hypothetical protein A0H81_13942 [Grifola frondosa]|uniref:Uncharacterized protein n=1 Tax=Grifola frondosa TaxID=5627 RepID=A0A1C7LTE1_GRIFR|nr:hypothetical protein A0H81_13942 [Grifola frondosa]
MLRLKAPILAVSVSLCHRLPAEYIFFVHGEPSEWTMLDAGVTYRTPFIRIILVEHAVLMLRVADSENTAELAALEIELMDALNSLLKDGEAEPRKLMRTMVDGRCEAVPASDQETCLREEKSDNMKNTEAEPEPESKLMNRMLGTPLTWTGALDEASKFGALRTHPRFNWTTHSYPIPLAPPLY